MRCFYNIKNDAFTTSRTKHSLFMKMSDTDVSEIILGCQRMTKHIKLYSHESGKRQTEEKTGQIIYTPLTPSKCLLILLPVVVESSLCSFPCFFEVVVGGKVVVELLEEVLVVVVIVEDLVGLVVVVVLGYGVVTVLVLVVLVVLVAVVVVLSVVVVVVDLLVLVVVTDCPGHVEQSVQHAPFIKHFPF